MTKVMGRVCKPSTPMYHKYSDTCTCRRYKQMQKIFKKRAIYILGTVNKSVELEMSQHTTTMSTQCGKFDSTLQQWAHGVLNVTGHCNNEHTVC